MGSRVSLPAYEAGYVCVVNCLRDCLVGKTAQRVGNTQAEYVWPVAHVLQRTVRSRGAEMDVLN